jgi:purine-cytosine permease-like protein
MYFIGLSAQVVSKMALLIPRFVYTLIGGAVCLVCSIAGRDHLEAVMTNFLNICAYYVTPFTTIVLADCYIWRRGFKYDLEAWNDGSRLPLGVAASVSFVLGTLVALLCMSQAWWVGPIAAAIGVPNRHGHQLDPRRRCFHCGLRSCEAFRVLQIGSLICWLGLIACSVLLF